MSNRGHSNCPTLIKIDLSTMKNETIFVGPQLNCRAYSNNYYGALKDLGNGNLVYAVGFNISILDS